MDKNSVGKGLFLRTREIVIKQGFDNVRSKIDVNTIVLSAASHLPVEIVSRCSKA